MARRGIDVSKVSHEIEAKIRSERSVKWKGKAFAEKVADHLVDVVWDEVAILNTTAPGTHPFETGGFIESVTVEQQRVAKGSRFGGRFIAAWQVVSRHPHANFIEFGTGPDKPGSRSPWGPNTPTPEYGVFARTAHHFGGTAP